MFSSRKLPLWSPRSGASPDFNGAGMFSSRKCDGRCAESAGDEGFNGAEMFSSRKCPLLSSTNCCVRPLQWGRDVFIPKMSGGSYEILREGMLQWGRDVFIPEMRLAENLSRRGADRFNGARDVFIPEMQAWGSVR